MSQTIAKHHLDFLKSYLKQNLIPKGLQLKFTTQIYKADETDVTSQITTVIEETQQSILQRIIEHFEIIIY